MARIKDEVEQIIGRRIAGVVIKGLKPGQAVDEGSGSPTGQLFLLFDDGTHYEFYVAVGALHTTGGVARGNLDDVLSYMGDRFRPVWVGFHG